MNAFCSLTFYSDACSHVECPKGSECLVNRTTNLAECICRPYCKPHYKPVCGSDGVMYENHCELHRASCVSGQRITVHSHGCDTPQTAFVMTTTPEGMLLQYGAELRRWVGHHRPLPLQTVSGVTLVHPLPKYIVPFEIFKTSKAPDSSIFVFIILFPFVLISCQHVGAVSRNRHKFSFLYRHHIETCVI